MTYAVDAVHREIAYVAHHLHWSLEEIMDLEHHDRRRYAALAGQLAEGRW